ncbi:MAG: hypothetical protein ABH843_07465 [Candidatus Omnitrophota bacterium]
MTRYSFIIAAFMILTQSITSDVYAAYVGNPSRVFGSGSDKKDCAVFTEAIADIIYDRGAKFQSDDMKVDFYGAKAGIIFKNTCFFYGGAGSAKVEEEYIIRDLRVKWESDDSFTWLAGASFKVYEKELKYFYNSTLLVGFDGQYRNTGIDPDIISIDSAEYNMPHTDISYSTMEYNDWHLSFTCALGMGAFSPYMGFKYSDFESCVRVRRDNIVYQKDNAEADDNLGIFAGLSVKIIDSLSANAEAGFIDEEYLSAGLSWKF